MEALVQSMEVSKDKGVFEQMDDDIVLDTNLLQSIATDLTKGSSTVNKDVIGEDMAKKLVEIEEKEKSAGDEEVDKNEESPAVSEVAAKIVESLTSSHVLGKVLTPEEANILKDYFSRKI
ncbi:unnamed protein product, partial [Gongylonema pulchrum]|uniref:Ovule protein n=1 Tax=Gongylonema pulchrum TaxID=637853 RepID=A0A183DBT7_9BILA